MKTPLLSLLFALSIFCLYSCSGSTTIESDTATIDQPVSDEITGPNEALLEEDAENAQAEEDGFDGSEFVGDPLKTFDVGTNDPNNGKREVNRLALSTDGNYLAATSYKELQLWDINSGKQLWATKGHRGTVQSIDINPASTLVASGGYDGNLNLWNLQDGSLVKTLSTGMSYVESISFSPDGGRIAVTTFDGEIKIYSADTYRILFSEQGGNSSATWSKDGKLFACMNDNGVINIYESDEYKKMFTVDGGASLAEGMDNSIAFTPEIDAIYFSAADKSIQKFLFMTETKEKGILPSASYGPIAISPDGKSLAAATTQSEVYLFETSSGTGYPELEGHQKGSVCGWINTIDFAADGKTFATGGCDGLVHIWKSSY